MDASERRSLVNYYKLCYPLKPECKERLMDSNETLDRICTNCNYSYPAERGGSDESICLRDADFEPYVDRLLARGDYACCADLIKEKRFPSDRDACDEFDPVEFDGTETSPELSADLDTLLAEGAMTRENLEKVLAAEAFRKTDWSQEPIDGYLERLHNARTDSERDKALNRIGWLVSQDNREAFIALCAYLRSLPLAQTPSDCHFRAEVLRYLSSRREYHPKLARVIVDDLLRTPSNAHTRSWFTEAWQFFERCSDEVREETLRPILDSPKFSYRIKRVVRNIIDVGSRYG